jgi:hypothetical protein
VVYRRLQAGPEFNANLYDLTEGHRSQVPLGADLAPYLQIEAGDRTLLFESRFESGNLSMAVKVNDLEYNLLMQHDTNSKGHTQWFYYRVSNTSQGSKVKFNICNFVKADSLFNQGMKVLVRSETDTQAKGTGWTRDCTDIAYYANGLRREESSRSYFSLTFCYEFEHSEDTVYFAYSQPYTYSDLLHDFDALENHEVKKQFVARKTLCTTLAGNKVECLTVTGGEYFNHSDKKGVVISARAHPGESVGSWMMKGVVDYLTGPSREAELLRKHFVFKLIPMLNPDGVINGNYRCSLAGVDLNRRWKTPSKLLHPEVYHCKRLIKHFAKERSLVLVCDLHGHSRKKNVFVYGCPVPEMPSASRMFPVLLSKISPFFCLRSCKFNLENGKEGTLRISVFKEVQVQTVYTLEASFLGIDKGPYSGQHLTQTMLEDMGKHLCQGLLVYHHINADNSELDSLWSKAALEEASRTAEEFPEESDSSTGGSDSDPSDDNLDIEELQRLLPSEESKSKSPLKKSVAGERRAGERRGISSRSFTGGRNVMKPREPTKCRLCGQLELPGHICPPKQRPRYSPKKVGLKTYFSPSGKTVVDQATQTNQSELMRGRAKSDIMRNPGSFHLTRADEEGRKATLLTKINTPQMRRTPELKRDMRLLGVSNQVKVEQALESRGRATMPYRPDRRQMNAPAGYAKRRW